MNKKEIISTVSKKTGFSNDKSTFILNTILEVISENLKKEEVRFIGFGTFCTVNKKERYALIPGTKKEILVPPRIVVKFKPGKKLKDAVSNNIINY